MFLKLINIVFLTIYTITVTESQYAYGKTNGQKRRHDKTSIINKGVWIKNKFNDDTSINDQINRNNFIFRESSLDTDMIQNNFDAFGDNYMQELPFLSEFNGRKKRSSRYWSKRPRKSITGKNIRTRRIGQSSEYKNINSPQPTVIDDLKPLLGFNAYPYEVPLMPKIDKELNVSIKNKIQAREANVTLDTTTRSNYNKNVTIIESPTISIGIELNDTSNETNKNVTSPKRSMKYDFETEIIKKIEFTEDINKTENTKNNNRLIDRNIFEKDNFEWQQTVHVPDINVYKVVPKEPHQKSKPVTERGLLKVIAMLTKTFKKIAKQHNEITDIHAVINEVNDEFRKTADTFHSKFQDFELKYSQLVNFQDKIKELELKYVNQEDYFLNKQKEMTRTFKEFESQQKKFLLQQKQFYNIQKLMLAQNEKINAKQNLIAKTQSEISNRQNSFASILKKAKQIYSGSKNNTITKLKTPKEVILKPIEENIIQVQTTTQGPEVTTESVKINLFSLPTSNKLQQNPDELILREKDEQAIDDLVYKYYFNNTFIDNFMRNKILNSFIGAADNSMDASNTKFKRNNLETTILLPVMEDKESNTINHNRERRWITHHNSRPLKKRRDHRRLTTTPKIVTTEDLPLTDIPKGVGLSIVYVPLNILEKEQLQQKHMKKNPFYTMATRFCNEINKNSDQQTLRWCIEKALRRLQYLEAKMVPKASQLTTKPPLPPTANKAEENHENWNNPLSDIKKNSLTNNGIPATNQQVQTRRVPQSTVAPVPLTLVTLKTLETAFTNLPDQHLEDVFNFPDNDALESKLKEYDMTPDTEGNVYYDGSLHASDIVDSESGVDDIMPGLDSNSRVEVDPLAFAVQAKRRAFVRKLNERLKMSLL